MTMFRRAAWGRAQSALEHGVEDVLRRLPGDARAAGRKPSRARVVVLGGGTGLSTVLGGNSALPAWPDQPPAGLVREFADVHVGVCTTDDGGSTGDLVRRLPMIGIGDLRKVMLSMADRAELARRYGPDSAALAVIQRVFLHRFGARSPRRAELRDPVRVLPPGLRKTCPPRLRAELARCTAGLPPWVAARLRAPGHCLGNLLLTAAVFRGVRTPRAPTTAELEQGLARVAEAIGAPAGRVHAATASPGTLIYEYANGVVAAGQARAARAQAQVSRNQAGYTGLRAPHAGVIAARQAEAGQVVAAGQTIFVMAADGGREIAIDLPEDRIATFKVGDRAQVELWSAPGRRLPAHVREIAAAADAQTRSFPARVALDDPLPDGVVLGQSARVYLAAGDGQDQDGLLVPLAALQPGPDGGAAVWVVRAGQAQQVPVLAQAPGSEQVRVRGRGLQAGDWVVAAGGHLLRDGELVAPVDRDNAPVAAAAAPATPARAD